jgi:hypothetical protein
MLHGGSAMLDADELSVGEIQSALLYRHAGYWAEQTLGYHNEPFHDEWYGLELIYPRVAVVAPREYAKSEVFSVITTAHHVQWAGYWQYLFSDTLDQAEELAARAVSLIGDARPDLVETMYRDEKGDKIFANYSRLTVGGRGKKIRGAHPDRIVGDDILDDESTATHHQRQKVHKWWFGTVAEMAHGPITRRLGWGRNITPSMQQVIAVPPTNFVLVGTPFHEEDLLLGMRQNPIYHFRRYEAFYHPGDLVMEGSLAVEIA